MRLVLVICLLPCLQAVCVINSCSRWIAKAKSNNVKMSLWLLALLVMVVNGRQECNQSQNQVVEEEFANCATKLAHNYYLARTQLVKTSDIETAICQLFSQTFNNCGKILEQCYGKEVIRKKKDWYIIVHGIDVNLCARLKEYRESGRTDEEYPDEDLCSNAKTDEVSRQFQTCSHSTSSAAYQTVMDISDPTTIIDSLCKALTTIGTVCVKMLKECYNIKDLNRMRNDHVKEMKSFLWQIVVGKLKNDSLSNCPILKTIDKPVEYEDEEFEDYDKTNEINGNQLVHGTPHGVVQEEHVDEHHEETPESTMENMESEKDDLTQIIEHELEVVSIPEVSNTNSKEDSTAAPTTVSSSTELPKVVEVTTKKPKMSKGIQYAVKVETVVKQKMTGESGNSSASFCVVRREIMVLCLVFFLLSQYV